MDTEERIKEWLLKGGLPFEMEVSNHFINSGFMTAQSVYYQDIETGKYREADVIAHIPKKINGIFVNLTFVIECKSSADKPWVILQNDRLTNFIDQDHDVFLSENFQKIKENICAAEYKSNLLFRNNKKFGYTLTTAFNNGSDKAYEAIQTTLKACEYFVKSTNTSTRRVANLYFPVIVVKGDLYNCNMKSNELKLKKITEGEIILSRSFHEYRNSTIFIFNHQNLESNIKKLRNTCDEFFNNYNHIIEKTLEK